ncbi:MAG: hypothetical protein Q8898_15620 [Bacillota bacterium]|nr:hypothetical protein [Bacillota bacterium]
MDITVDFHDIESKQPKAFEHIVVTDGFSFRSGYWMMTTGGEGFFYADPDYPFEFVFWTTTADK